jgi:hypothetical protein
VCVDGQVFGICAAVCEAEYFVADAETFLYAVAEAFNCPAEFDAESFGGLRGDWVVPFALEEIHAVEAEGFDFDDGFTVGGGGFGNGVVDEEGVGVTGAVLDVWEVGVSVMLSYSWSAFAVGGSMKS